MTPIERAAYDAGYKEGWEDTGTNCPYPEDSEEEICWLFGYNAALDDYSRSFYV